MLKLINKLTHYLTLQLENNELTEDSLRNGVMVFVKDFVAFLLQVPQEFDLDFYFTFTQIEKTMLNLQLYIGSKFHKTPFKEFFIKEGFQSGEQSSSDESEFVSTVTRTMKKRHSLQLDQKPTHYHPTESISLEQLQHLLEEANDKLMKRNEQILQMSMSYLKDIQHLKQMFLKQIENPETEFIEVNYFDVKQSLSPEVQQYMTGKFNSLNDSWQQKTQKLKIELAAATAESESYKKTLQVLLQNNTVQSILKTLFLIEKDPYKIWKQIQDQVGNKLLFQVFENQIGGYGINYREIDELIGKNSAGARMFQRQKLLYEEQLKLLIEDNNQIINNLKNEITTHEAQLKEQQLIHEEYYNTLQAQFNEQLQQQIKEERSKLEKEFQAEKQIIQNNLCDTQLLKKLSFKTAFARWQDLVALNKIYTCNIQDEEGAYKFKLLIKRYLTQICKNQQEYGDLKENAVQNKLQLIQYDSEKQFFESRCKQLQFEIQRYANNISMMKQTIQNQKADIAMYESQIKLITKPFCLILQKIGYPSKVNLLSILKSGINLEFLQSDDQDIKSSLINYFLTAIASQIINQQNPNRDAETITEFFDIRFALTQEINYEIQGQQSPDNPIIKFQITEQAISPKDLVNFTYDKPQVKATQKTPSNTNQTPKSMTNNNFSSINTPKVRKENGEKSARSKGQGKLMLESVTSGFQKQMEKIKLNTKMIEEVNYVDKAIQVELSAHQKLNDIAQEDRNQSPQQDVLVIMRDDCQSRQSWMPKRRSISVSNNKKQKQTFHRDLLNTQNISLLQASKLKSLNKTIYSDPQQQDGGIVYFPPQSPFQFYQDLFREKQKMQMKNYTIIKEQKPQTRRKFEPNIEGRQLQIPIYLKQ